VTVETNVDGSVGSALYNEVLGYYIQEAWLLDERKYDDWLQLFTDDTFYFMPRRKNVLRREIARELTKPGDMSFFEETKEMLQVRITRLETGMAWSEDPPSRTRHLIGNLQVLNATESEIKARTAFMVFKSHLETDTAFYSGYREDTLRRTDEGLKIASRTIVLDANVLLSKNISIFF
jgi:3-phenylpropionate/cinnamic acid dioxygenase small subunit